MPLTRQQKEAMVADIEQRLKAQQSAVFVDFQGLKVSEVQAIKKTLKAQSIELKVYKKTLIARALKSVGIAVEVGQFTGSLGLVLDAANEIGAPKFAVQVAKKFEALKILGGIFERKFATIADVKALALIPTRDELLGQLLGVLQGPSRGFAVALNEVVAGFVRALNAKAMK